MVAWNKKFQTFSSCFFWKRPSKSCIAGFKTIFVCFLISWSGRYSVKLATSTALNFNNSWPLYLNFPNMVDFCPDIWFNKSSKCQQLLFWKMNRKNTQIVHIFKEPLFRNEWPIDMNVDVLWEISVCFLKSVVLQLFSKYSKGYVSLNVKSTAKFNCL